MELKDFVSETLAQIIAGVKAAQTAEDGANVNAKMANIGGGNLLNGGTYGIATRVDFDVSVSAETEGKGGGKLQVLNIVDLGAEGSHKRTAANRVSFSVPVRLPDGDETRAKAIEDKEKAEDQARRGQARDSGGGWMAQ